MFRDTNVFHVKNNFFTSQQNNIKLKSFDRLNRLNCVYIVPSLLKFNVSYLLS